ncbi:VOC family protein [Streptomyces sp. NRRL F-5123]|uniref:VOC family protein n=1 Tax=Streptomyces sp. NRRL F-5123 TaxID=1463856 RepID=UPI000D14639B|nr:VOC family protein [Streptomyces sp. NRRL F-5123]
MSRNEPQPDRARIEDFLRERGADRIPHPGGTLLAHLGRVERMLDEWGAGPDVRTAGLCHAAYGTDGFDEALIGTGERARLAALVGERAEELVHFYASCDRSAVYPQLGQGSPVVFRDRFSGAEGVPAEADLRALMEITAANELDLVEHNADLAARYGPDLADLFTRSRGLLSAPAQEACTRLLGRYGAGPVTGPLVGGLDHLVLTVADVEAGIAFYERVLGMRPVTFGDGRRALAFGTVKINLHPAGRELLPHAARPTPGSADLCLVTPYPQARVLEHLAACGVPVEAGPVPRTGALGPFTSTYLRDPDGNLVEISSYPQEQGHQAAPGS